MPRRVLHLRIHTSEAGESQLVPFLRAARPFYEAPGGLRVRLLRSASDPRSWLEIIEYDDESAFEADDLRVREDPEMAGWLSRWRALLESGPVVEVWEELTEALEAGSDEKDNG